MHQAKPSSFGCICSLSFTLMMLLPQDSSKHTVRTTHSVPLVPGRDLGAPGQFAVGWCTASPSAHCPQTMQSTASSPCSMEPIQKNPVLSWESEPHTQCLIMQGLRKNVYKYLRLLAFGTVGESTSLFCNRFLPLCSQAGVKQGESLVHLENTSLLH